MSDKIEIDIKVPNQTRYLGLIGKIGEDVARTLKRYKGDREELAYHINLVLTEAMANVIVHANEGDPAREVHISIAIIDHKLHIRVFDEGRGFDVGAVPVPAHDHLAEHGRGIYLIRTLMDQVVYSKLNGRHVLEMIKTLN